MAPVQRAEQTEEDAMQIPILKKVIEEAKNRNCDKIIVRTTNDNLDALRFYQRKNRDHPSRSLSIFGINSRRESMVYLKCLSDSIRRCQSDD